MKHMFKLPLIKKYLGLWAVFAPGHRLSYRTRDLDAAYRFVRSRNAIHMPGA